MNAGGRFFNSLSRNNLLPGGAALRTAASRARPGGRTVSAMPL